MRAFIVVLGLSSTLWAQDPPAPPKQEVTIYGTSPLTGEDVFDAGYSVDVIPSADMITRRQSRTLPEALEETPGVSIQKTGPGQGSPFIRGFTGFRNVLLIDGIRLNNSIFREGPNQYWATVDTYMIDRLEVIRGPSSVLYGSDSMGGTVLASTREPAFADGTNFDGRTIGRYASAEQSYTARQEFSGNFSDLGWVVGGTYRDYNDVIGGKHVGRMEGTAYDQYSADAKTVFRVGKDARIIVAAQHDRTNDAPRWHRTADSPSWHGSAPGTDSRHDFDQERNLYYVQYRAEYEDALVDDVWASVSYHRQAEDEIRLRANGVRNIRAHEVDTPGAFLQLGKQTNIGYLTLGADAYRDDVQSEGHDVSAAGVRTDLPRGNVAGEATYLLWGVYLQDEITIGALDLTPGVRFSRASVDADDVDPVPGGSIAPDELDDDYQAVTGSLRAVYHLTERWNVIGGWGMGFRAPSLDDSTASATVASGSTDFGGPDLDPERSHTFDLGVRADYGTWGLTAFGFYTILDDFIIRVPIGDVNGDAVVDFARDNAAEGWVYGFEVALFCKLTEEVTLFADWGYARGKVDQVDGAGVDQGEQPLGKVGPSMIHVGARWEPKNSGVWIEALVTAADDQTHLSFTDKSDTQRIPPDGTPGYTIYTLRGGYRVNEHLALTMAVENISDKDYRVHGSGQNEPGTNAVLGADLRF